jgi:protocatechuate 3,4-dioxygenase beta subunit
MVFLFVISVFYSTLPAHAAEITGVVKDSAGSPITGTQIGVEAYTGNPCMSYQWAGSALTNTADGVYSITGLPAGTYYLRSDNIDQSDYVTEWWNGDTDPSNIACSLAQATQVGQFDVVGSRHFQLELGGSVSGTVRDTGDNPISGFGGQVIARYMIGNEANDFEWAAVNTVDGTYTLRGLPTSGSIFLRTGDSNYASTWWTSSGGTYLWGSAQTPVVPSTGADFKLAQGAVLQGIVLDSTGTPVENIEVIYWSEMAWTWKAALTDISGAFTLNGLPPGGTHISVKPQVSSGLVRFEEHYYIFQGENKDIGVVKLKAGAKVYGYIKGPGDVTLPETIRFDVWSQNDEFGITTDPDGYFEVVLPPSGYLYHMTLWEIGKYTMVPETFNVTPGDISTGIDLGTLTAYDSGDVYSGTISGPPLGVGILDVAALENTDDLFEAGLLNEIEDPGAGYSLFVPPGQATQILLLLMWDGADGQGSETILDRVVDLTGGGTVDFTYITGSTVDGYIKNNDDPVYLAGAILRRTDGSIAGYADTDHNGHYILYHVPAGTYRIEVDHNNIRGIKSDYFTVPGDITVPSFDISVGDELTVDFGVSWGVWHYDGNSTWNQLSAVNVQWLGAYADKLVGDFGAGCPGPRQQRQYPGGLEQRGCGGFWSRLGGLVL